MLCNFPLGPIGNDQRRLNRRRRWQARLPGRCNRASPGSRWTITRSSRLRGTTSNLPRGCIIGLAMMLRPEFCGSTVGFRLHLWDPHNCWWLWWVVHSGAEPGVRGIMCTLFAFSTIHTPSITMVFTEKEAWYLFIDLDVRKQYGFGR